VLLIVDRLALASLTARKEIGVTAAADRPRLGAEHAAEHHAALSRLPLCHAHQFQRQGDIA
jgi:hypothetical protein